MKKTIFILIGKVAGIVDPPSKNLSDIFQPGTEKLKPEVLSSIDNGLYSIKNYLSTAYPDVYIENHELIGASVTYQYTNESDIDITVFLNINKNDSRFSIIDDWIGKNVDKKMYYNKRPFQFKIMPTSSMHQGSHADGIYSPTNANFSLKPNLDASSTSFRSYIEPGNSPDRIRYKKMEANIRGMVMSWGKVGRNALESGDPKEIINRWLEPQARELMSALSRIKDERSVAYENQVMNGRINKNWSTGNVLFKFLERDGYIDFLKMIKKALTDSQIHPENGFLARAGELEKTVHAAEGIMNQSLGYSPFGEVIGK